MSEAMKYYAIIDGEQKGPFELEALSEAGVRPSTYVWCKGMPDWEKAEDVADVCRMFRRRLIDIMHPGVGGEQTGADTDATPAQQADDNARNQEMRPVSRFDRYLADSGEHLPTLEEMDAMEDKGVPPAKTMLMAILATILFFPPTGLAAIYFSHKSAKYWREAENDASQKGKPGHDGGSPEERSVAELREMAHLSSRNAKMWTGITICLGIIFYAMLSWL